MTLNTTQKPIECHRVKGGGSAGVAPRIDQTLTQDATGTLAMLSLDRAKTAVSVQYVDHNLLQIDNLNAEDTSSSKAPIADGHMVFATRQRDQPSCSYGAFRASRYIDAGLRQTYAGGELALHAGGRRRRIGCRARCGG